MGSMQNERQLPVESLPNREFLRKEFLNFGHCLSSNVAAWNLGTQMRRRRYTMKYYECNLLSSVRHQENPVKSNQKRRVWDSRDWNCIEMKCSWSWISTDVKIYGYRQNSMSRNVSRTLGGILLSLSRRCWRLKINPEQISRIQLLQFLMLKCRAKQYPFWQIDSDEYTFTISCG